MFLNNVLHQLLAIGRQGDFSRLDDIQDFQDRQSLYRLAGAWRDRVIDFGCSQPIDDRIAFTKAIAMLEHRVGGLGSITLLQYLVPLDSPDDRPLIDWILLNTTSYWYYAYSTRSLEELDEIKRQHVTRAAEGIQRDQFRQQKDKKRIADTAASNLFNAVRRGDAKAVRALIAKGANSSITSPDGSSLLEFAASKGFDAVVLELREAASLFQESIGEHKPTSHGT